MKFAELLEEAAVFKITRRTGSITRVQNMSLEKIKSSPAFSSAERNSIMALAVGETFTTQSNEVSGHTTIEITRTT